MSRFLALLVGAFLLACPAAAQDGPRGGAVDGFELLRAGRPAAALPHLRQALDQAEAQYGPNHPQITVDLNNLAEAYRMLGRYAEAEPLYLRAIAIDEKAGRGDLPGLATSLNNLALLYRAQNRLDKAERLYRRSLALLERALGPNHPDVARSLNNLAALYRTRGEIDRARSLQERAVAIAESTLGPRDPTTITLRRNLAGLDGAAPDRKAPPAGTRLAAAPAVTATDAPPAAGSSPAAATDAAGGTFAVQLAAVSDPAQVAPEWRRLSGRFPLLNELTPRPAQEIEIPGKGKFYRVLAGAFATREAAEAMCGRIRAAGASCRLARP